MEITFRKVRLEDVEGLIDLCNECFNEETKVEYAIDLFKKTEADPNNIYLIGILDGKIIAHTKLTIVHTIFEEMNMYAILNHVCVKPEYRRHNLATRMLEIVEQICIDQGCKTLKLWSNNVRVPAHKCYKKFGFVLQEAGFFEKQIRK